MSKKRTNRLGFAILLAFFRERGRFPRDESEIEMQGIALLSQQLEVPIPIDSEATLIGRTAERLRSEIRTRFGFHEATVADAKILTTWLRDHVAGEFGGNIDPMIACLEARCKELLIEPPTLDRMDRIARSALRAHEDRFHNSIYERLSPEQRENLDALLRPEKFYRENVEQDNYTTSASALLLKLQGNPGRPSLANMQAELAKLELIRNQKVALLVADENLQLAGRKVGTLQSRSAVWIYSSAAWGDPEKVQQKVNFPASARFDVLGDGGW